VAWGGIPVRFAFGDVQQLPAVACKALYDSDPASKSASAFACGRLAMSNYLDPPPGTNDGVIAVIMDKVIRQTDPDCRNLLQKVRDGTLDDDAVDFLLRRHYSSLSKEERESFDKDALFLMPTWKRTKPITKKYLLQVGNYIAVVKADESDLKYQIHSPDFSLIPSTDVLMVGARVQLQANF
jgi:hypothetical protein